MPPIHSDGEGYYVYLSSYFIYKDLTIKKIAAKRFNQNTHLLSLAGEIQITAIHNINRTSFHNKIINNIYIMDFTTYYLDNSGDIPA